MKRLRYVGGYRKPNQMSGYEKRIKALIVLTLVIFLVIVIRLFKLQILEHQEYSQMAKAQHFAFLELPAKRGEIFVRDKSSAQLSKLATNTTLNLLYVDPNADIENPLTDDQRRGLAQALAPLVFTEEDYQLCLQEPEECVYSIEQENAHSFSASELLLRLNPQQTQTPVENPETSPDQESISALQAEPVFKPYATMVSEVEEEIVKKISKLEVDFVVLKREASAELMEAVEKEKIPGIFVEKDRLLIHGDPTLIPKTPKDELTKISKKVASLLDEDAKVIEKALSRRPVHYVFLKNRLTPEISEKIEAFKTLEAEEAKKQIAALKKQDLSNDERKKKVQEIEQAMKFKSVVLLPEHWRYYPEDSLAAHIIGFVSRENVGQYGVEGYFNAELEGKSGTIYSEKANNGRQVNVDEGEIVNAVNGDDIVLTIDRIVQKKVQTVLAEAVESYKADSGQVIVMEPFTGAIVAMASYPDFNPNAYSEALTLRKVEKDEQPYKTTRVFKKDDLGKYVNIEEGDLENSDIEKFVYENRLGDGAFKNPAVSDFYEPGSTFKPLVMAIALDAAEVTPQTTYNDDGPKMIDGYEINNSTDKYHGVVNMTKVLEESLNTGMVFVVKRLGPKLLYDYLKKFGLGQYANLTLEGESQGGLTYYEDWSKAQLLTTSYGQGIVVTPLQLVTAWAALANGGRLMQPYIVESVIRGDEVIKTEPQVIRRVISEQTSSIITSMLVSVIGSSHYTRAYIDGYLLAGKTGTAQISKGAAGYETGEGSVITSFISYFPAYEPRFVVYVKFDRPRLNADACGENTAIPVSKQITQFLIEHYQIQPS